ncbi:hypothetical protein ACLGIH_20470 [Streptomyces sp. HMX87]|uniref:hypothetical protein n=1 Tax=Streptomyces sp. HMX87 TaxID=3390849 RepID=UPI003A8C0831
MSAPRFIYHPTTPPGDEPTRFQVYVDPVGSALEVDDTYLGTVYLTSGGGWVADWSKLNGAPALAMPGFQSKEDAASALYWFAPPAQSARSRPAGRALSMSDERKIDLSQCGCCVNNDCECEGLNRISQRFGVTQTYQVQPSLIPAPGALFSLLPMKDSGDFLVDLNTWGAGSGIGYLQQRDDGRFDVRVGAKSLGIAPSPETGMWACLQAHTGTKLYGRLLDGFESHDQAPTDTK